MKKIVCSLLISVIGMFLMNGCLISTQKQSVKEVDNIENAPFELTVMNIGKADCILIRIDDKYIMIDTGLKKSGEYILEELKNNNVESLEYLILTHMDKDHIGGANTVINNIKINNLIAANYSKDSKQYTNYIEAVNKNNLKPTLLHKNMNLDINGAKINIYPAEKNYYEQSNDYSIIVEIKYGEYKYLFAGDSEAERLNEFLNNNDKQYTFVKIPHHGRLNKLSETFIKEINPSYAVITCSEEENAEDELLKLLNKYKVKTLLTKDGEVTFKSDGNSISYTVN